MATISELVVKIVADTTGLDSGVNKATDSIKKVGDESKDASGKTQSLSDKFGGLKTALVGAGLVAAFVAVGKAIADSVKAFAEAEISAKRLEAVASMRGWEDGAERISKLADSIQALTGVDGDYVKQLGAELLAQGKTLEQTENLITAASQLSSITGDDLGTSVKQLTNTYSGMAGIIGRTIPEVKELTEEQLKNGAAVDIILEKYAGLSSQLTDTVSVSTARTSEAVGDLKEAFGQAFSGTVVSAANAITAAINGMLPAITYLSTHSFSRMFQELYETVTGTTGAYTEWENAVKEADRATVSHNAGLRALQTELDAVTAKTKTMSDAELEAARNFLIAQMSRATSMDQLTQSQKKLDAFDTEIATRRKKQREEALADKKKADAEAAEAAKKAAEDEAKARIKNEKDTKDYTIAQEDIISKAKADAYGDSIVAAAKEADARTEKAKSSGAEQLQIFEQVYSQMRAIAVALNDYIQAAATAQLAAIDAETQAALIAADVQEQTELERIQAELDAAIAAGDTELAAQKQEELTRAQIIAEGEKKKAKIKYDADLWSWGTNLALAISDAARAIIVGYAQLGPVAGSAAAAGTAIVTGLQIAAMSKAKPVAPAFARGTDFAPGGMATVNEEGAEMINLPLGSTVTPATRTASGGGAVVNIYSPTAVNPSEAATIFTRTARDLAFQGVL